MKDAKHSYTFEKINLQGDEFLNLIQSSPITINQVLPPSLADESCLVFASTAELFRTAKERNCRAFIILDSIFNSIKGEILPSYAVSTTVSIPAAMSAILPLFDKKNKLPQETRSPSSVIHPTAQVASSAIIDPHVVIEAHAIIGENTHIKSFSLIGAYCEIGKNCIIGPHVTIGSDGFGFYTDSNSKHRKINQIGKVVIEDNCEIGSHCAVDRATLTETRIKSGSKLDNFCHIAHNVQIGDNALIAAGFIVAGSTKIGKNLMTSGAVHILGHLTVPDNVILTARAGVLQDIEKSGIYGGFPLEPQKESVKTYLSIPHIKHLRSQIKKILKHLNMDSDL